MPREWQPPSASGHDLTATHVWGTCLPSCEGKETQWALDPWHERDNDFQAQEVMVSGFPKNVVQEEKKQKFRAVWQIASQGEL